MHIESPKKRVLKSEKEVFAFLADPANFEKLMPDTIEKFRLLDPDTFLFSLRGMPEIVLKKKKEHPHSQVVYGAASDKLPFTLSAQIRALSEQETEVTLNFEGAFNAMMAMMVKAPITNFLNTLSENLGKI